VSNLDPVNRAGLPSHATGTTLEQVLSDELLGRVADVVAGQVNEIDVDDLVLAVEVWGPLRQADHMRLVRVASLAIQYYRMNPGHSERAFYKQFAAVCHVDPKELEAYVLVLQREIRYREKNGYSPLGDLPRLIESAQLPDPNVLEALALPAPSRFKHDPSEYVALAEQGLNNTEIAKHLGDVSEAAVRRGLAAVGYERCRDWAGG
jgi:hypothetical protein